MSDIPSDCIKIISEYLSIVDVIKIRQLCKHWRESLVCDPSIFSIRLKTVFLSSLSSRRNLLKINSETALQLLAYLARCRSHVNLQQEVLYASSSDRWEETPLKMITNANGKCYHLRSMWGSQRPFGLAQILCQCSHGNPCYWSSAPSEDENSTEFLILRCTSICVIDSIILRPYEASWHPSSPVYAPKQVIIEFLEPSSNPVKYPRLPSQRNKIDSFLCDPQFASVEKVYYRSPPFSVRHSGEPQTLKLPSPQLLLGGRIRIIFHGKYQRQTLGGDEFYMCLNPCEVLGIPLSCNVSIVEEATRDMAGDIPVTYIHINEITL